MLVWLLTIVKANLLPELRLNELIDENNQLCRMIGGSVATATENLRGKSRRDPPCDNPQ